ncbi:hypothetical protein ACWDGI_39300 [Streptomyces sp. NPDC001220]
MGVDTPHHNSRRFRRSCYRGRLTTGSYAAGHQVVATARKPDTVREQFPDAGDATLGGLIVLILVRPQRRTATAHGDGAPAVPAPDRSPSPAAADPGGHTA